jgi:hypothetical protein
VQKKFHIFVRAGVKPMTDQQLQDWVLLRAVAAASNVSNKQLVILTGSRSSPPTESGLRSMPRYFFNTRIGDELIADPEGEELRNPDRAWEVARAMIRELLKTEGAQNGLLNATLEVTDDEGEIVLEFPFAEAILDSSGHRVTKH